MRKPTEAEQNRLIIENQDLIKPIATKYRGAKGIPWEDLVAQGQLGLVQAARMWIPKANFQTYAVHKIHSAILDFIRDWQPLAEYQEKPLSPSDDGVWRDWYEWSEWPHCAPYERWTRLDATPEDLLCAWDEIRQHRQIIGTALLFFPPRERSIFWARHFREPQQTLNSIARHHKISYDKTVRILNRMLEELTEIVSKRVLAAG